MKNYVAQLADNVVEAIIVGDYDWAVANLPGNWHDLGPEPLTVAIGYTYDPTTDTFSPPVVEDAPE